MFSVLGRILRRINHGEACFTAARNLQAAKERLIEAKRRGDTRAQHDAYRNLREARHAALRLELGR